MIWSVILWIIISSILGPNRLCGGVAIINAPSSGTRINFDAKIKYFITFVSITLQSTLPTNSSTALSTHFSSRCCKGISSRYCQRRWLQIYFHSKSWRLWGNVTKHRIYCHKLNPNFRAWTTWPRTCFPSWTRAPSVQLSSSAKNGSGWFQRWEITFRLKNLHLQFFYFYCNVRCVTKCWLQGMLWKKLIERKVNTDSLWKGLADRFHSCSDTFLFWTQAN